MLMTCMQQQPQRLLTCPFTRPTPDGVLIEHHFITAEGGPSLRMYKLFVGENYHTGVST
jgi:hypothetical protein